jgi:HK97 family phage prohead protease
MLSPDSRAYRARRQAETPLSVLCRIPEPALPAIRAANDTRVILGIATRFLKTFVHDHKIRVLMPGALDKSLNSGRDVRLLIGHDDKLEVGSTRDGRLELAVTKGGLAFRYRFGDGPLDSETKRLIEKEMFCAVSIGFKYLRTEMKTIADAASPANQLICKKYRYAQAARCRMHTQRCQKTPESRWLCFQVCGVLKVMAQGLKCRRRSKTFNFHWQS